MTKTPEQDKAILMAIFARMDVVAMAIAVGVCFALALFLATALLLLQATPEDFAIGTHLGALSDYLPGYGVSWSGSIVGALYGFLIGILTGLVFAILWNLNHYLAIGILLVRSSELFD